MPPLLGQILYTSFPVGGFRLIASPLIPPGLHRLFTRQIAERHWDPYNPRPRSAYILQPSVQECLFGWVFDDGKDELGRDHVPYFLSYFLPQPLEAFQIENICLCLSRGPASRIDRQSIADTIDDLSAPDLWSYRPARSGVFIPDDLRVQTRKALLQGRLLDLFIPETATEDTALDPPTYENLVQALANHVGPLAAVIVRQAVTQAASLGSSREQLWQIYRSLRDEIDDPAERPRFEARLRQILNLGPA